MSNSAGPRVSVVMPVYNGERYIAEAVASVLASDFADLELLVLDDGSTDASIAEATRAAAGDARLHVIQLTHVGVAAARNAGLHAARGEFIANLDSDDAMFPDRLRRQVAYLDANPDCVAAGSRALVVDANGNPVRVGVRLYSHEEIDNAHLDGRGGAIWNPTATFRTRAAKDIGGYAEHLQTTGEDVDLWLRLAEVGRLVNLPEVLTRYRVHGANVSLSATDAARRLEVTLETVGRAFVRRGIVGRVPAKRDASPSLPSDRRVDKALLQYYNGARLRALFGAAVALALNPSTTVTRAAVRTILHSPPPRWERT